MASNRAFWGRVWVGIVSTSFVLGCSGDSSLQPRTETIPSSPGAQDSGTAPQPAADVTLGTDRLIVMPGNYEGHDIQLATVTDPGAVTTQIYGTSSHTQSFEYCHALVKGTVMQFESTQEALERHKLAVNLPLGDSILPTDLVTGTVGAYGARYFLDGGKPNLYFPIQDKGIVFALDPLEKSETHALLSSIAFANRVFELSGLKDTFPVRVIDLKTDPVIPATVKVASVVPSPYGQITREGLATVKVTLSYDFSEVQQLDVSAAAFVYSTDDTPEQIQALQTAADANPVMANVSSGTGEITLEIPVDLTTAQIGQRVRIDAAFSITTTSGLVVHPVERLVQYTIGS